MCRNLEAPSHPLRAFAVQEDECRERTNKRFSSSLEGARTSERRRNRERVVEIEHVYGQNNAAMQEALEEAFGDEDYH